MKVFSKEDIENMKEKREKNDRMEDFFKDKRKEWNGKLDDIFNKIQHENLNANDFKKVIDAQSLALSYLTHLNDEISMFLNKMSKSNSDLKMSKQDKFIFYSTGFSMKTNLGEKKILIDAHVAEDERSVEILESHIDFLRETKESLVSFNYSVKNIIQLLDFLGK